ncbi:hypothetical protein [Peribacillus sp. NPDC097225]|uniref:hypothetical protein n=1 Tax=Peribacillus sp. NPDC097225 TaxID=3364400 RepID=UPI00380F7E42
MIWNDQLNKENLWKGCMVAMIAHAIMVARYPELSYEHSWDGSNDSMIDGSGGRGTLTFTEKHIVAAFRNENIIRTDINRAVDYFKGASQEIIELAENEALQYLLMEGDDGKTIPSITTAFWGDINSVSSNDTIVKFVQSGGYLIENQLLDYTSAIDAWREYYKMSKDQIKLLESLYKRKVERKESNIVLTRNEIKVLGTDDIEGLRESQNSFEEIGIMFKGD